MTPAARYAAAIEVLDAWRVGARAEQALSNWGRGNRFAGAKDRAAIRDHVFDVLRRKRSVVALGGAETGRGMILGLLRQQGIDPNDVFGAGGYAPAGLASDEQTQMTPMLSAAEAHDMPDWLWPVWKADLGAAAEDAAQVLRERGPITLRVNQRRATRQEAAALLEQDGIITQPAHQVGSCLFVTQNPRRVKTSTAYLTGLVELQDLASQRAIMTLDIAPGTSVLDYCAGGGGKSLALADLFDCTVTAHDIDAKRMKDLPVRAGRAQADIAMADKQRLKQLPGFDHVFVDAPCSGAGTWRRNPEAKWDITLDKLSDINALQSEVIKNAATFVRPGGRVTYATCSVLHCENRQVVDRFLMANPQWQCLAEDLRLPDANGDGFYFANLQLR